jgi:hypothetical protein
MVTFPPFPVFVQPVISGNEVLKIIKGTCRVLLTEKCDTVGLTLQDHMLNGNIFIFVYSTTL